MRFVDIVICTHIGKTDMAAAIGFKTKLFFSFPSSWTSWRDEVLYGVHKLYFPHLSRAQCFECILKLLVFDTIVLSAFSLHGLPGIGSGGCEEKLNLFETVKLDKLAG